MKLYSLTVFHKYNKLVVGKARTFWASSKRERAQKLSRCKKLIKQNHIEPQVLCRDFEIDTNETGLTRVKLLDFLDSLRFTGPEPDHPSTGVEGEIKELKL